MAVTASALPGRACLGAEHGHMGKSRHGVPAGFGEPCRHCKKRTATRPRGLCWVCFSTKGVRDQYPSPTGDAMQAAAVKKGTRKVERLLPEPTDAPPGSEEKIRVLQERWRLGQQLKHPDDARTDTE